MCQICWIIICVVIISVNFEAKLRKSKKAIVFSPHIDDGVLSCGNMIKYLAENSVEIVVVNVFTNGSKLSSDLTRKLLRQGSVGNAGEYFAKRKKEDQIAISQIGEKIIILNLGFIDAAWRLSDIGAVYKKTTIGVFDPYDYKIQILIKEKLNQIKTEEESLIFCPIARGRHVDHIIVRNVVGEIFKEVIYYLDQPYSDDYKDEEIFTKNNSLTKIMIKSKRSVKEKVIEFYSSQQKSFEGYEDMNFTEETFYFR